MALAIAVATLVPTTARADHSTPTQAELIRDALADLRTAAGCKDKKSPWRPLCIATDWSNGSASELPKGHILVGLTIQLLRSKPDDPMGNLTFVALAIGNDGKVKLTDVKPTNPDEEKAVAEAVFNVSSFFKGKSTTAKLPSDMAAYVKTLTGTYTARKQDNAWAWRGASDSQMRKVGKFWVVLEVPDARNGVFATILTDAWQ
jgi:hypothetical protein